MREFDFEKYKAIIDYITNATGSVTTSIDSLIKGTLELRKNAVTSIVRFSTSVKEVVMGVIVYTIADNKLSTASSVTIDINGYSAEFEFGESWQPSQSSLMPKTITIDVVNKLGDSFVLKTTGTPKVVRIYADGVSSFAGDNVPTVKFFNENYLTKKDSEIPSPLTVSSVSPGNDTDVVSIGAAKTMSGAKRGAKEINIDAKNISSNFFAGADGEVRFVSSVQSVSIDDTNTIYDAPSEKSLVTQSNIGKVVIKKDLSNANEVNISGGETDASSVVTKDEAMSKIVAAGAVTEDVITLNNLVQPQYVPSRLHYNTYRDTESEKYISAYSRVAEILDGDIDIDKNDVAERAGAFYAVFMSGYSPTSQEISSSLGSSLTTIKLVYEFVASALFFKNNNLFMSNYEYNQLSNISSLLLKENSSPEFYRRPEMLSNGNTVLQIADVEQKISALKNTGTGHKNRGW